MNEFSESETGIRRIKGPTILLGSGTYFDFEDPESSMITIQDIAWGLANQARFAGQTSWQNNLDYLPSVRCFYSVAQHCVVMSHIVPIVIAYPALMHDAAEAVMGDMPRPLKSICPDFRAIEKRVEAAIFRRFKVEIPTELKHWDLTMLRTEQEQLMNCSGELWTDLDDILPHPTARLTPTWEPSYAAERFLYRYRELTIEPVGEQTSKENSPCPPQNHIDSN